MRSRNSPRTRSHDGITSLARFGNGGRGGTTGACALAAAVAPVAGTAAAVGCARAAALDDRTRVVMMIARDHRCNDSLTTIRIDTASLTKRNAASRDSLHAALSRD